MPRDLLGPGKHADGGRTREQRQRAAHSRVRNRVVIPVEADVGRFPGRDGPQDVDREGMRGQRQEPSLLLGEDVRHGPIAVLGMANSRMKDYYDLWLIAGTFAFEGSVLTRAVRATFERRGTEPAADDPIGLTREFVEAQDSVKRWRAFLDTAGITDAPKNLEDVIAAVRTLVLPPVRAAADRRSFEQDWSPGTGWR